MRINYVNKARKDRGTCEKCHEPIKAGDGYKFVEPKFGPQRRRHASCPSWRPSELTGSEVLSLAYAAQENVEDVLAEWDPADGTDALGEALTDAAEQAREAAELRRESASNIEDGFGHRTFKCDELEEDADALESWADEMEDALSNVDDPPEVDEEDEDPAPAAEQLDAWADEVRSAVEAAIGNMPL